MKVNIETLNEYQSIANDTAIYPNKNTINGLIYTALGLGEAGEVQNKVKKVIRDDKGIVTEEKRVAIAKELGGNLWYIAMCAKELGYSLSDIANMNLNELKDRKSRGVIQGSGDNR